MSLRLPPTTASRLGLVVAVGTAALLVLASGALGIVGDGGRPDRAYVAVPAVLVLGSLAARLRPRGMVLALGATALTQVVVSASVLLAGVHGDASVVDVVGITAMFAGLFAASAGLYTVAAG
ncbi:hypothetical protein G6553_00560 [Nocardioides sp. IC4_145]|uniref:hypothetical protein n=1 Tax=Nocardioides sp. IC4_145 TaxID=2714037 RepID=UPI00140C3767|nr:hypothetical protein [Nocardioides sp. IC4_145]NHC21663.1 hypothetical protein [Nocardioides sp. IC4_145]